MDFIPTQIATAENQFGYSDFEAVIYDSPELVIELVLTVPFDEEESPYIRLILGDADERFDNDMAGLPITREQAFRLLSQE